MSEIDYKETARKAVNKIKQTYENSPFKKLILEEIERPNLLKFVEERVKESGTFKMSMPVTEYFNNFNKYPDKIVNVLVVETHDDYARLKENGYFVNPNNTLVLCLNNTFGVNKETNKTKSHYDYWRLFVTEALDYLQTPGLSSKTNYRFVFAGSDVVHDFSELITDSVEKILLPETSAACYKDKSLEFFEFASELK